MDQKTERSHALYVTLITRYELSQLLKLSGRTIARLLAKGGLPSPIKVGCSDRWRIADIERFLTEQ